MDLSNENVIHKKENGIEYLQFRKLLEYPEIWHAFAIKPLNFRGYNAGKFIATDYKKFLENQSQEYNMLIRPLQEHTDKVIRVDKKINEDSPDLFLDYLNQVDGIVTDKKEFILATTSADCIALIIYDPVKKVIANVHSGWRGTFKKISLKAVEKMKEEYGCNPEDIIVCICPSIRKCHFEVKTDVESECRKIFDYTGKLEEIIEFKSVENDEDKFMIDTILITKLLLKEAGIKKENIIDSNICSLCYNEQINSRRGDGGNFGLNAAFIKLNKKEDL